MNPILELHRPALFQFQSLPSGFLRSGTSSLIDELQRKTQASPGSGASRH